MTAGYDYSVPRLTAPGGVPSRLFFGCGVVLGLLVLGAVSVWPARATDSAARATQDGWWNRLQGPVEGEAEANPIRPLVPALPVSPTVPGDAIAVGASGGQVDKIAAVDIEVALPAGARLEALTLRLSESPANGANVNADTARVAACPAVTPWGPSKNAAWNDRPQGDCTLAQATGKRSDDGAWAFDLTPLGVGWTHSVAAPARYGVVLAVEPTPGVTQVSWRDFDSGHIDLELTATMPPPVSPAASTAGAADHPSGSSINPAGAFSADSLRSVPPGAGTFVLGMVIPDPLVVPSGAPAFPPASASATDASSSALGPAESPVSQAAATGSAPSPRVPARPPVGFWEHVPASAALLPPVALGLAVLLGVALGPAGRPEPVFRRSGGLSRALARHKGSGETSPENHEGGFTQ